MKFRFGVYEVDLVRRTCSNGSPVRLGWRSFEALRLLVEARGAVVDKERLYEALWPGVRVEESSLGKCIGGLRRSLNQEGSVDYIETIPRAGYRLAVPIEEVREADPPPPAVNRASVSPRKRLGWRAWAALTLAAAAAVTAAVWPHAARWSRAREMYAEGQKLMTLNRPEGIPQAIEAYRMAIQLSPRQARYHASLADAMTRLPRGPGYDYGIALEAAERAVALDPACADCQAVLGFVLFSQERQWKRAGEHMRRAVEIDPGHPGRHGYLAMQLASQGHLDRALVEVDRGISIQPYQATLHGIRSTILCLSGRYADAIAAADRAISFRRVRDSAWDWRAYSLFELGKPAEGVLSYVHRLFEPDLAEAEAVIEREGVNAGLQWLLNRTSQPSVRAARGVNRGHWKLLLGDREGAVQELKTAETIRHFDLIYLPLNPAFAPLREHPEFRAIVDRMRLSHVRP